jgi:hypothetical protein
VRDKTKNLSRRSAARGQHRVYVNEKIERIHIIIKAPATKILKPIFGHIMITPFQVGAKAPFSSSVTTATTHASKVEQENNTDYSTSSYNY